jgi:hypothetical protein
MAKNTYENARSLTDARASAPFWSEPMSPEENTPAVIKKASAKVSRDVKPAVPGGDSFSKMSRIGEMLHSEIDNHDTDEAISIPDSFNARKLVSAGVTATNDAWNRHRDEDFAGASAKLGEAAGHFTNAAKHIEGSSGYRVSDFPRQVSDIGHLGIAHRVHEGYVSDLPKGKK